MEGKGHGEKLSRLKEQALAALIGSGTLREAAHKIGVSRQTLGSWLKVPEFAAAFKQAKQEVGQEMLLQLQLVGGRTVDRTLYIMENDQAPFGVQLSAARHLMGGSLRAIEIDAFDDRLTEIERCLGIPTPESEPEPAVDASPVPPHAAPALDPFEGETNNPRGLKLAPVPAGALSRIGGPGGTAQPPVLAPLPQRWAGALWAGGRRPG